MTIEIWSGIRLDFLQITTVQWVGPSPSANLAPEGVHLPLSLRGLGVFVPWQWRPVA